MTGALANSFGGLLNYVFRRRMAEVLQFEVTECGTCCLAMVLSYFGHWEPLDRVRQLCGASRDGVSAGSLARAAKQLNMNVKGFGVKVAAVFLPYDFGPIDVDDQNSFDISEKLLRKREG